MAEGRHAFWVVAAIIAATALLGVAALLWWKLPDWKPELVMRHSPFVDPALSAYRASNRLLSFDVSDVLADRLRGPWGAVVAPALLRRAKGSDRDQRDEALRLLTHIRDPGALSTFADALTSDDPDLVACAATYMAVAPRRPAGLVSAAMARALAARGPSIPPRDLAMFVALARACAPDVNALSLPTMLEVISVIRDSPIAASCLEGVYGLPLPARVTALRHPDPVVVVW